MTDAAWEETVAHLAEQLQELRAQLARRRLPVEQTKTGTLPAQMAELAAVILAHLDQCSDQLSAMEQLQTAQLDTEKRLWQFIEGAPVAIAMFDCQMRYLVVSQRWISDYGLQGQYIIGESHYTVFPEISDEWKAIHRRALAGEVMRAAEDKFVRANGTVQWLRWEVRPWYHDDTTVGGLIMFTEDITDLKTVEERLERQNRALRLLSTTNEALIRAKTEDALIQHVCDVAVEAGGYRLAWVGFVEHDADKTVRPIAHAGVDDGYLACHDFSWDGARPEGQGLIGQAVNAKQPISADDLATEPCFDPWRADALARGYRAEIALPLIAYEEVIGVFALYRGDPYHFTDGEQALFMELANDLAYGILTLRTRMARREAEEALRKSEAYQREFSRRTIAAATDGKLIISERADIERIAGPALATWEIAQTEDLQVIRHAVAAIAKSLGMEEARLDDFLLCISESATNAYKHAGYGTCSLHRLDETLFAVVADQGPGILPINLPELALKPGYTTAVSLGMGYKAMIRLADTIYLATGPTGTVVGIQMAFHAPAAPEPAFPGIKDNW